MVSEVADITYHESMMIIVKAMLATVQKEFHITDEQIECFYNKFMSSCLSPCNAYCKLIEKFIF